MGGGAGPDRLSRLDRQDHRRHAVDLGGNALQPVPLLVEGDVGIALDVVPRVEDEASVEAPQSKVQADRITDPGQVGNQEGSSQPRVAEEGHCRG